MGGSGSVVLIRGEPGIGKTRLAEAVSEYAALAGCVSVWGRCPEERGAPPFWPWAQVLPRLVSSVGLKLGSLRGMELVLTAFPELGGRTRSVSRPGAGEHARFRLFDAVSRLLAEAARRRPVLLVLDDLHWADEPSLKLLQQVAQETKDARVMILGTHRPSQSGEVLPEVLASVSRLRRYSQIAVRGLSREESAELLGAGRAGGLPEELAEAAYRLTGGNPLHLRQMAFLLSATDVSPAGTVQEVVTRRLEVLPAESRSVVAAAAVVGGEFSAGVLREMTREASAGEQTASLDEAQAAHLVEPCPEGPGRWRFVHALVRDAVLSGVSGEEKARLHGCAARVLERQYAGEEEAHAAELLRHFAGAQSICGSEPVVRYARLAGERALRAHAYEEALEQFETGLRSVEGRPTDDGAAALLFGVARSRALISMGHESLPYFVRCFEYYERTGNTAKAVEVLRYPHLPPEPAFGPLARRALGMVDPESLDAAYLLMVGEGTQSLFGPELTADDAVVDRIVAAARRHGDPLLEMKALRGSCLVAVFAERYREAMILDRSRRARGLARSLGEEIDEMWLSHGIVCSLLGLGRTDEAEREAESLRAVANRPGDRLVRGIAAYGAGEVAVHQARWDELLTLCDLMLETGMPRALELLQCLWWRAVARCQTGEAEAGLGDVSALVERMRQTPRVPAAVFGQGANAIAEAAYVSGEAHYFGEAESACLMVIGLPNANPFMKSWARRAVGLLAVLRSDKAQAEAQRAHFLGVLDQTPPEERLLRPWHHVLGLLARTVGRIDEAIRHFEDAVRRPGAAVHERAWSRHELAATLAARRQEGDCARAATVWRQALEEAIRFGLKPLEQRVRAGLESLEREGPATMRPPVPGGLSAREVEVLALIVRGLTNREIGEKLFISIKTVDAHVRSILEKTGMANRTEATAYAIRNGLVEG